MLCPKWQEHKSLNYCIDVNQILLNDKDQQFNISDRGLHTGSVSAIYDCLVSYILQFPELQMVLHCSCSLTCRFYMRYESLSAKFPFISKLNVLCEKLDMSLTDTQLPMFCRLMELCIALYYGTLELPAATTAPESEEVIDRNVEDKEGMLG